MTTADRCPACGGKVLIHVTITETEFDGSKVLLQAPPFPTPTCDDHGEVSPITEDEWQEHCARKNVDPEAWR